MRKWIVAWVLLISIPIAYAANTALSNLSASGAIAGGNLFYVVQSAGVGGVKATATQVATYINSLFSGSCTATSGGALTCTDAGLSTSDITTNNVSTAKHGFAPKSPNDATKYLDGTGAYTVPAGGGSSNLPFPVDIQNNGWYVLLNAAGVANGVVQSINTMYCGFSITGKAIKIGAAGVYITTASAAHNVQVGIYSADGSSLIANTTSISTTTGTLQSAAFAGAATPTLAANTGYWQCTNEDNAVPVYESWTGTTNGTLAMLGSLTGANIGSGTGVIGRSFAQTFGTWPASITPTGGTDVTSRQIPIILLQAVVP